MGMFDSFWINENGKKEEVQTKKLGKCLENWCVGDNVVWENANTLSMLVVEDRHNFIPKDQYCEPYPNGWVAFVIYRGVFVEYVLGDSEDDARDKGKVILQSYLENSSSQLERTVDILREGNERFETLKRKNSYALRKLIDAANFLQGEDFIFRIGERNFAKLRWNNIPSLDSTREQKLEYILSQICKDVQDSFPSYSPDYYQNNKFEEYEEY
jgi:hypothetical protein